MKYFAVLLFLTISITFGFGQINNYEKEWAGIDTLEHFRKLDEALKRVETLMAKAYKDAKNPTAKAHYIKAFIYKSKYEIEKSLKRNDTEDNPYCYLKELEELSNRLTTQISLADDPVIITMLHYSIADILLQYRKDFYICNNIRERARLEKRIAKRLEEIEELEQLTELEEEDSISKVLTALEMRIATHLLLSTRSNATKGIAAHHFAVLLENSEYIDTTQFRYSLHDMLLDNAIWYLDNNSSYLPFENPNQMFPYRDSLAFARAADFIRFDFTVQDPYALRFEAYKLYQELLRTHLNDSDKNILAKFDFERVLFAYRYGHEKINQNPGYFLDCLVKLEKKYAETAFSTTIAYKIGKNLIEDYYYYRSFLIPDSRWNLKRAYRLCAAAIARHPNSVGAKNCQIVINKLLQKELRLELESASPTETPILMKIHSKNIAKVYCKIIPIPLDYHREKAIIEHWDFRLNRDSAWTAYIQKIDMKNAQNWSVEIPNSGDFRVHSVEYAIPAQHTGAYLLLLSEKEDFAFDANGLVYAYFQVSGLAFIVRGRKLENVYDEFFVVNRNTGAPIAGAEAVFYNEKLQELGRKTSTEQGYFTNEGIQNTLYTVKISYKEDYLHLPDKINVRDYDYDKEGIKNYFFTDKSIYRPGQKLHYKGIMTEFKYNGLNNVLPDKKTKIIFYDVNSQAVAHHYVTTNEYGSYSGIFDIPTSGLLGSMSLYDSLTGRSIYFSVEEYKKPTFEISMNTGWRDGADKDTLIVDGTAETFSKMPLAGAQVKYTLLKEKTINNRYGRYDYHHTRLDTVAVSVTQVQNDGSYHFFHETPTEKDTMVSGCNYYIYADITDLSGETHSITRTHFYSNPNYLPWQTQKNRKAALEKVSIYFDKKFKQQLKRDKKTLIASFSATARKGDWTTYPEKISGRWVIEQLKTPENANTDRLWSMPDTLLWTKESFHHLFPLYEYKKAESWLSNWQVVDTIYNQSFKDLSEVNLVLNTKKWAIGSYRLTLETVNSFGDYQIEHKYFALADWLPIPAYNEAIQLYQPESQSLTFKGEPGDTILLPIGSYFSNANILLELENYRRVHEYRWLRPQRFEEVPIILEEKHRGNLHFRLISVYNNRLHSYQNQISVPWSNKALQIEYLTFRDNLLPGQEETWTIKIKGPDGRAFAAEVLASMYDAALDELKPHRWQLDVFNTRYSHSLRNWETQDNHINRSFQVKPYPNWQLAIPEYEETIDPSLLNPRSFLFFNEIWYMQNPGSNDWDGDGVPNDKDLEPFSPPGISVNENGIAIKKLRIIEEEKYMKEMMKESMLSSEHGARMANKILQEEMMLAKVLMDSSEIDPNSPPSPDFGDVKVRSDLKETVFFYPHLTTAEDGTVSIKFTMSEALSKWKLMIAAHGKDMESMLSTKELITQKKLMVMPSTPRFLRQGDVLEISSKVSNLSEETLKGKVTLQLFYADSEESIDAYFENRDNIKDFELNKGAVNKVAWRIRIPEDWTEPVMYRIIAKAGNFSDGEQNQLPVISNKLLVTEAMPVIIHGNSKQDFTFKSLKNNDSKTLKHHRLTLELTPNPAWDAVLSIPYLMEYPHECSEQLFSRFYANSLATQVVNSNPKIKAVFEQWAAKNPSNTHFDKLLANPALKSALMEETPWVLEAKDDAVRRRHIGQLFDLTKMAEEFNRVKDKLVERQSEDGGFAWFNGGHSSLFITQYIVGGIGKLSRLGANPLEKDAQAKRMFQKAVSYMDAAIVKNYQNLKSRYQNDPSRKKDKNALMLEDNLNYETIQYLYVKSFFWDKAGIEKDTALTESINFYLQHAAFHWRNKSLYHQGMIALSLQRMNGDSKLAKTIADSIKILATIDTDKGMYWQHQWGYYWYELPIETQALMIELFAEVAKDEKAVYNLKLWLLQNKRGAAWASTKATTSACYALLVTGGDWLSAGKEIAVTMGATKIDQTSVEKEAGSGYFQMSWGADEINADMADIGFENPNPSPAFGAVYWQYFEELDNIKSFKDTPLKLTKSLFLEENTVTGLKKTPIAAAQLKPGDLVKVHIELEVTADMEYLHMKDMRAAGFEPISVLSGYKWQDGLGYYESTRDASTNFFFDKLPKGRYVFEYPLRVNHKGEFSNGITTIQSMYAPEYSSHSEGVRVTIGN